MENQKKAKKHLNRKEVIANMKSLLSDLEEGFSRGDEELTEQEKCRIAHVGQCGECEADGSFIHC